MISRSSKDVQRTISLGTTIFFSTYPQPSFVSQSNQSNVCYLSVHFNAQYIFDKDMFNFQDTNIEAQQPSNVTHAHGVQYKYSGHTISFPQDINSIAKFLPRQIEYLDILIVKREGSQFKHCYFTVCRSHVMNALHYKIQMDKYYRDVKLIQSQLNIFHINQHMFLIY